VRTESAGDENAVGAAPASYREVHVGADKARSYDEDLWDPTTAKGLEWLVEQQLLAEVLATEIPEGSLAVADFACGTGRVLEFLERSFPSPVGIDISPDMLALAAARCPRADLVLGDVTETPGLVPGPFDLITAFRFFLNAETALRHQVLDWMRGVLRPGGVVVANFHLNPRSVRGTYLRLRMPAPTSLPMMTAHDACRLLEAHGFDVRRVFGYSFLPYRRDGRKLRAPRVRLALERRLAGTGAMRPIAGSFIVVAALEASGIAS